MNFASFLGPDIVKAVGVIYGCLAQNYPDLIKGVTEIVGGATLLFGAGQTGVASKLNGLLPPAFAGIFSSLGGLLGKVGLNVPAPK